MTVHVSENGVGLGTRLTLHSSNGFHCMHEAPPPGKIDRDLGNTLQIYDCTKSVAKGHMKG